MKAFICTFASFPPIFVLMSCPSLSAMKINILVSFLFVMIQYLTGATLKERRLILGRGFRGHSGKGMASNVQFLVMEACTCCFSQIGRSSSRERRTTVRAITLKGHPSVSHLYHPGPHNFPKLYQHSQGTTCPST